MQPSLSVIVCTRNRLERLKRCVAALFDVASEVAWELVIVDNGSTDGTAAFLHGLTSPRPNISIKAIGEPRRGLANAHNAGWRAARAGLVSIIDDDCYVAADYVDAVLAAFERPDVAFFAGRVLLYDKSDIDLTIQERASPFDIPEKCFVLPGDVLGANMGFRKVVLDRIGGFDPRFGPGARFNCEDVNAIASAVWAGFAGIYDPRIVVHHHHGRKPRDRRRMVNSYAHGVGAYYARFIMRPDSRRTYLRILRMQVKNEARYHGIQYCRVLFFHAIGAARYCVGI